MKKILLATIVAAFMATSAHAACEGGTLSDDGKFCISNISLNWWSAANWCKANGMHLATMYEACPNWDGNIGTSVNCDTIKSDISTFAWTSTARGDTTAYTLYLNDGRVDGSNSWNNRHSTRPLALCTN